MFDIILFEHTPNLLKLYNNPWALHSELNMKYVERYRVKSITIEFIERLALTLDIEEGD